MRTIPPTSNDIAAALGYLAAHNIWRGVPRGALEENLRGHAWVCLYDKGEDVWGGAAEYRRALGLVLEGEAQVRKERLLLSIHRRGDFFGLATLFNQYGFYAADIQATNACRVLFLAQEAVEALLDAHPAAAKEYISYLSQRVYFLNSRLDAVTAGTAARRLENYLRSVARPDGFCEIQSYSALAKTLGMGRASLYRALDELKAQGIAAHAERGIALQSRR
ncbi:MAG: Crp/Fnr family transcriptional regulator [Oscillospiraceae bacterium]|jgi:CRP-like cAMP-binding protein|nr:Crp/Fnr family transcriptional regulator [Oscillospiraceae bacterium]